MRVEVNCTSVLGMRFKERIQKKINPASCILYLASFILLLFAVVKAEVLERVVAIVDDEVILFSELNEAMQSAINSKAKTTEEEVLDGMVNRILLLKEAKKFRLDKKDDNTLINEYIENRLRAFVRIPFEEIELFYKNNRKTFGNKEFYDVRDEIETYLIEKELNRRLLEHIKELREKAYIRIQLP